MHERRLGVGSRPAEKGPASFTGGDGTDGFQQQPDPVPDIS